MGMAYARALSVCSTIGQPLRKQDFVRGFQMEMVIGPGPGARSTVQRRGISMRRKVSGRPRATRPM
eukprot:5177526-Amphidinium_carterae.1